jgi:hypothetical protein
LDLLKDLTLLLDLCNGVILDGWVFGVKVRNRSLVGRAHGVSDFVLALKSVTVSDRKAAALSVDSLSTRTAVYENV